ncbi:MAG TPA: hypothetical protein VGM41_10605 [Chitinophagaceae bacterium]
MMKNPKPLPQSATPTEQQSLDAIEQLKDTLTDMAKLRRSLRSLQEGGFHLMPDTRRLKVQPVFRETRQTPIASFQALPFMVVGCKTPVLTASST